MQKGHTEIELGHGTGMLGSMQCPPSAKACIDSTGKLIVSSAEPGYRTGHHTPSWRDAAEAMSFPMEQVEFKLG